MFIYEFMAYKYADIMGCGQHFGLFEGDVDMNIVTDCVILVRLANVLCESIIVYVNIEGNITGTIVRNTPHYFDTGTSN